MYGKIQVSCLGIIDVVWKKKNEKFDVEKNEKLMWEKKMNILPHKIFCPKC
jgi:hypothetical protein